MRVLARSPGSINRSTMYREMEMRMLLLHLILRGSQICSDVLKRCKGQERAGDYDGITHRVPQRVILS